MRLQIEVEFKDYASMMIWSANVLKPGTSVNIDVESGLRIHCPPLVERRAFPGAEAIFTILAEIGDKWDDVTLNLLTSWLYDKLKNTKSKVKVGKKTIDEMDSEESIRKAIDHEVRKKE